MEEEVNRIDREYLLKKREKLFSKKQNINQFKKLSQEDDDDDYKYLRDGVIEDKMRKSSKNIIIHEITEDYIINLDLSIEKETIK